MTNPSELSKKSEEILRELSLELIQSNENSWTKSFEWKNNDMKFGIEFDRMYYDCYVLPQQRPIENLYLIKLLRFLKNDSNFYAQELIFANLSYTLPINNYVELFYEHYHLIKDFLSNYNQEAYARYNKYEVHYNGI